MQTKSAFFVDCVTGTRHFTEKQNNHFGTVVKISRIKIGNRQTIETLIIEEASLFAKYLRNEKKEWIPRIPTIQPLVNKF